MFKIIKYLAIKYLKKTLITDNLKVVLLSNIYKLTKKAIIKKISFKIISKIIKASNLVNQKTKY